MFEAAALKLALIDLAREADIRFTVTPRQEAEIADLAARVEQLNPTPQPTVDALHLLAGRWRLLYGDVSLERQATLRRLSFARLPEVEVTVTGVYQEVSADGAHYNSLVEFRVGELHGVQESLGRFTAQPPNRINYSFAEACVYPLERDLAEREFRAQLGVDSSACLRAPVDCDGWMDVTYLDNDLRLMRGSLRNLCIIVRDESPITSF
ncbi:MAG TPA: PAP/fibrillin family protein [Steroidobacteraceae bacterium]